MKKSLIFLLISLLIVSVFTGCKNNKDNSEEVPKLKVGVTAGPHEAILEKVKELAEKEELQIEIITFNDYIQPNIQLADGNIDLNSFQHEPFLEKFIKDRNLKLVKIANTVNFPMGIYSKKIKSLKELKEGDKIGLPNDPTNEARALKLFEAAGLIKLKDGAGINATLTDISNNPKNLEFIELEAPMIFPTLPDLTAAAINTNFVVQTGWLPAKDSIFMEPKDSPWANIIVCRQGEEDNPLFKKFIEIYHSQEVKEFINKKYKGSLIPCW